MNLPVGLVLVTGSKVADSTGALVNGTIYFKPVDTNGRPISYQLYGGGQVIDVEVKATILNGTFELLLPDTSLTNPANICFSARMTNQRGDDLLGPGYTQVQPHATTRYVGDWCANGVCNFDQYIPHAAGQYVTDITGPAGPEGPAGSLEEAQVNADWAATTGVQEILNKPTLGTAALVDITAFDPAGAAAVAQAVATAAAQTYSTNAGNLSSGTVPVAQLPIATASVLGIVKPDGTTITIASGVLTAIGGGGGSTGVVGGDLSGSLPNPTVSKINGQTPGNIITHNAADFDTAGVAVTAQQNAIAASLQKSANLSDLASVTTARTNLGLGSSATQSSAAFDAAGAAATALTNAETYSANASNLSSGTVAAGRLPIATSSTVGVVKPDGSTTVMGTGGAISAVAQVPAFTGDITNSGVAVTVVKINGATPGNIVTHNAADFDAAGTASAAQTAAQSYAANASNLASGTVAIARLPVATSSTLGIVEPDGSTIIVTGNGLLTAVAAAPMGMVGGDLSGSLPNPTVAKVNGVTPGNIISHNAADFDAAGAASTALTSAESYASNASNLASGTVAASRLPALSGDVTSATGSASVTVTGVHGVAVPTTATLLGTDSTGHLVSQTGTIPNNTSGSAGSLSTPLIVAQGGLGASTSPVAAQVLIAQSGSAYAPETVSGDATLGTGGALTVTKTAGVAFAASATSDTTNAVNITSGTIAPARLPIATTAALGVIKPDGTTVVVSGSGLLTAVGAAPSGVAGGDLSGTFPNPTVSKINGSTPGNIVTHSAAEFLTVANNLSDLQSPSAARTNLGLGTAATASTSAFDAAGAATTALNTAESFSSNASNLASGTVAPGRLPLATTAAFGAVKVDGSTITAATGVISAVSPSGAANTVLATPNGSSGVSSLRALVAADLPLATASVFGAVKPDGSTITIASGVITANASNPVGTAGGDLAGSYPNPSVAKINGAVPGNIVTHNAADFDVTGAALAAQTAAQAYSANASNLTSGTVAVARLPVATVSTLGVVEPDGTTITISSGVLTAVAAAPSGTVGGDLSGTLPNPTVAKVNGVTPGNIISHNAADFDAAGTAASAASSAQSAAISASETYSANASNLSSGTVPPSVLPTATTAAFGAVKPDGTSITVAGGVLSASVPTGSKNQVYATPTSASGTASLRALVAGDIPALPYDASGAAASAITTAEAYSANASNLTSGTVPAAQLPLATTSAVGAVKPDGSTITIASGVISAVAVASPSGTGNKVYATPNGSTGTATIRALVAADIPTLPYDASGAAATVQAASLQIANNLSDLASPSTARTNLGLGTAATQASSAFDAAGAAASAITTAEAYSANATNLTSGTVAVARLPVATTSVLGVVEPDGTTITIASGVISAVAAVAPSGTANKVYATPNGSTGTATLRALVAADIPSLPYDASGAAASAITTAETYSANASNLSSGTVPTAQLPVATTAALGLVKPDGSTITIASGVISAASVASPSGSANQVYATPNGSSGVAGLRALVAADIPTLPYDASGAAATAIATALLKANNLSDLASASTARTNLGLGTAATQSTSAFDAAGAASSALTTAEAFSANASNLSSGTVPAAQLPLATTSAVGAVKPDGTTLTISAGVIAASGSVPAVSTNEIAVSQLATPVNGTFTTATTGGSLPASTTYYYRVAAKDAVGTTLASTETSKATGAGTSTNTITVAWGAVSGAAQYSIYGRATGAELLIATVSAPTLTYTDTGSITPAGALPSANTTGTATVAGTLTVAGTNSFPGGVIGAQGGFPTYIQGAFNNANATLSTPFVLPNSAGNAIIVCQTCGLPNTQAVPTDTQGNTYFLVATTVNTASLSMFVYAAYNIKAGANTVTCNGSQTAAHTDVLIYEYSNVVLVNGLDTQTVANSASATSGQTLSVSTTTTNATDLLISFVFAASGSSTAYTTPPGFTLRANYNQGSGGAILAGADENVTVTGTYTASWVTGGAASQGYCLSLISLKAIVAADILDFKNYSNATVAAINGYGQVVVAATAGLPANTPNVGALAYNSTTATLSLYTGSGWTSISRAGFGDAASGANADITSMSALATISSAVNMTANLSLTGSHLVSAVGTAPTVAAVSSGGGSGATASLVAGSNDVSGVIILNTGTGGAGGNTCVTLTFNKTFAAAPKVFLSASPASSAASAIATAALSGATAVWVSSSTTNFLIQSGSTAPAASSTFAWNYWVIG